MADSSAPHVLRWGFLGTGWIASMMAKVRASCHIRDHYH
jgi:hypothetical protein